MVSFKPFERFWRIQRKYGCGLTYEIDFAGSLYFFFLHNRSKETQNFLCHETPIELSQNIGFGDI
jgi:hypothetical protein